MSSITDARRLSTLVGAAILAASTNAVILKTGGYLSSQALLVAALSAGVFAGARIVGAAWRQSTVLAGCIIAALAAGEIYNLVGTAERITQMREDMQIPLKALARKRQDALERLHALETGEITSSRLKLAKEALEAARQAVDDEARNGGCRKECQRKEAVAGQAAEEVKAAAREAQATRAAEIEAAKAEVEANPLPPSATPLADRLGCPPWVLDLMVAALLSVGANGLAGTLIAFGAHGSGTASGTARSGSAVPERSEPPPGRKRTRSERQLKANMIAAELRAKGITPKFHIVRNEYRNRHGEDPPKVTIHRACG